MMKVRKVIAMFLIFFSIYTAAACFFQLNHWFNAITSTDPNIIVAQTKFASFVILTIHFFQALSFFGLFYYAFSVLINVKLNYKSKNWLMFGILSAFLYVAELISFSLPLKPIEGYVSSYTFFDNFFEVLFSTNILYHNLFQLLAYVTFFGIYLQFKKELL